MKKVYLDLNLGRLTFDSADSVNGALYVQSIIKPELPLATLEQMRSDFGKEPKSFYEWSIICQDGRMKMFATDASNLKAWIVGVNALVNMRPYLPNMIGLLKVE